ncbi:MAG: tRNA (guanine(10)-N(2))-dimethyltransferase [Candidatus Micrarchaeota archaeon]|nr:tRNA (guanine(10)-N(2))-dimethyltransferase [Candidatus Micrarchaeota archaeon]
MAGRRARPIRTNAEGAGQTVGKGACSIRGGTEAARRMSEEGKCSIRTGEGVFYNLHMELCRDVSSLAVGAIGERLDVCDGMCASGVRGIRYKKENENVDSLVLVDLSRKACALARANAKKNKINATVRNCELNYFLANNFEFNFIEIDPFGSPHPFLFSAIRSLARNKTAYLSATATDTAVLCGAHHRACVKIYGARPIDNEFCHEIGVRILIARIVRIASAENFGTIPLISFSMRHYFKIMCRLEAGAEKAFESSKSIGYLSYCPKCLHRQTHPTPHLPKKCPVCKAQTDWAGPLWLGELHDAGIIEKMRKMNSERNYKNKTELAKLLFMMKNEIGMPPFYFDIHVIAKKKKISPPPMEKVIEKLRKKKFSVARTHFSPTSIKSDAATKEVGKAL